MAKGMYIGVSKADKLVNFTSNPAPTTWTDSSDYLSATATNDYGEWRVDAKYLQSSAYRVSKAVDDENLGTSYKTSLIDSDSKYAPLTLTLPTGVSIKPTSITVKHQFVGDRCKVQGSTNGTTWVDLATLTKASSNIRETFDITGDTYYLAFRLKLYRYSAAYEIIIDDFKITSGTIKTLSSNDFAHKVKKAYVGVENKARKVKKGYIGVAGIARLFYSAETLKTFSTCPFPDFTANTATNEYGTWTSSASSVWGASNSAHDAFDADTSTYWRSNELDTSGTAYVQLDFPSGVRIKPTKVTITYRQFGSGGCIQGYNPDIGEWVTIGDTGYTANSDYTETFTYNKATYFSAIRAYSNRYSSSYPTPRVSNLKITSGTLKIE